MSSRNPTPTASLDDALADVHEHGVAVLTDVLDESCTALVRARLLDAAAQSEARGVATRDYAFDPDGNNVRVFGLINLDALFRELIVHPVALRFVDATIGTPFSISNFSANILGPGAGSMGLHADQGYAVEPWPPVPLAVNVGWVLDDFSPEVGATQYVPGSHRLGRNPRLDEAVEVVSVEAPVGSILVMDGRLWHRSGVNTSLASRRAALFGYYIRPWIRPQINWNQALDAHVAAGLDGSFLDLLGYRHGLVDLGFSQRPHV
jgi:fumagillin biosynthesis dioxygenase